MNGWNLEFGSTSKNHRAAVLATVLPDFFKAMVPYTSKGGWLVGDGRQIYMCDFFVGQIYTDLVVNEKSGFTKAER